MSEPGVERAPQTGPVGDVGDDLGSAAVDVSLVVPVQHPEAEVRAVVQALGAELDRLGRSWECLLVYDGVRGPAWEAGIAMQERSGEQVRTIGLHKPFGEAVCLSSAFEHTRGRLVVTSPEYVQVDPRELSKLLEAIDDGADLAVSWRHPRIDTGLNRLQSACFNWVMRTLVGAQFHDLNCSLRVMRREVLEQLTVYGNMYRYLPVLAFQQGFRVDEVRVRHLAERGGPGIFGPGVYVRRMLDILGVVFLTKFTHRPLRFFGALGGFSMLLGLVVTATLVLSEVIDPAQPFFSQPLLLIGVLFLVLGVQIIGFGLVGEIIVFTQAKNVREYRIERIEE